MGELVKALPSGFWIGMVAVVERLNKGLMSVLAGQGGGVVAACTAQRKGSLMRNTCANPTPNPRPNPKPNPNCNPNPFVFRLHRATQKIVDEGHMRKPYP
eukprot:178967-Prorocentrum_minimum.AAC.1